MAVTKQTYTAASTWTAAQLADIFRSAFIDAGLMTDWFDSFTNAGIENRVLQVVNDVSKTYGTVYYWFMFTTAGGYIQTTLGWNEPSNVPSGTQYLDWLSNATNTVANHRLFFSGVTTTTATFTRYTSAVNTNCTWFVARCGTNRATFLIPYGTYNATGFVDQNKTAFNGAIEPGGVVNNGMCYLAMVPWAGHTRRTYLGATGLRGMTTASRYTGSDSQFRLISYGAIGNVNNFTVNIDSNESIIYLPTAHVNTQSALAADHTPVFTSILCSPYLPALPSDFGISTYYTSNTFSIQDTLIVSAGVEEWDITVPLNNGNQTDAGRLMLLARVVG